MASKFAYHNMACNSNEILEENDEFEFETDHVALRGNKDYNTLLKYIVTLEVQKCKALKDIEELSSARSTALEDPVNFLNVLRNHELQLPGRQNVPEIPKIDWSAYGIDENLETENDDSQVGDSEGQKITVRGRVYTENKPETFNQLWSCEEQRRLEELLEIYPEEEVESRRYQKIADALGTRTLKQVRSRIQKYFAKLAKAGLAIPGRKPRGIGEPKSSFNISGKNSKFLFKKSTFFPQLHVPVQMDDSTSFEPEEVLTKSMTFRGAIELLKAAKEQRELDEKYPIVQKNVMCVGCRKHEFIGARWTDDAGTDYCTDCIVQLLPNQQLTPIRNY